ncbi:hypothetical protein ABZ069_36745 [Streptomyces microflavus]|uniref:hypothetical protein n=1 Tax=Streptomyces microflavus TaxID=1919 RepID=UPI0033BEF5A4
MNTEDAWTYLNHAWIEAPELIDWESYCRQMRDQQQHYGEYPQPGPNDFFDCLTWYFYDCTRTAGLNARPDGWDDELYQQSVASLFWDFYPNFYEAYEKILNAYMTEAAEHAAAAQQAAPPYGADNSGYPPEEEAQGVSPNLVSRTLAEFADPEGSITTTDIATVSPYVGVELIEDDTPPTIP